MNVQQQFKKAIENKHSLLSFGEVLYKKVKNNDKSVIKQIVDTAITIIKGQKESFSERYFALLVIIIRYISNQVTERMLKYKELRNSRQIYFYYSQKNILDRLKQMAIESKDDAKFANISPIKNINDQKEFKNLLISSLQMWANIFPIDSQRNSSKFRNIYNELKEKHKIIFPDQMINTSPSLFEEPEQQRQQSHSYRKAQTQNIQEKQNDIKQVSAKQKEKWLDEGLIVISNVNEFQEIFLGDEATLATLDLMLDQFEFNVQNIPQKNTNGYEQLRLCQFEGQEPNLGGKIVDYADTLKEILSQYKKYKNQRLNYSQYNKISKEALILLNKKYQQQQKIQTPTQQNQLDQPQLIKQQFSFDNFGQFNNPIQGDPFQTFEPPKMDQIQINWGAWDQQNNNQLNDSQNQQKSFDSKNMAQQQFDFNNQNLFSTQFQNNQQTPQSQQQVQENQFFPQEITNENQFWGQQTKVNNQQENPYTNPPLVQEKQLSFQNNPYHESNATQNQQVQAQQNQTYAQPKSQSELTLAQSEFFELNQRDLFESPYHSQNNQKKEISIPKKVTPFDLEEEEQQNKDTFYTPISEKNQNFQFEQQPQLVAQAQMGQFVDQLIPQPQIIIQQPLQQIQQQQMSFGQFPIQNNYLNTFQPPNIGSFQPNYQQQNQQIIEQNQLNLNQSQNQSNSFDQINQQNNQIGLSQFQQDQAIKLQNQSFKSDQVYQKQEIYQDQQNNQQNISQRSSEYIANVMQLQQQNQQQQKNFEIDVNQIPNQINLSQRSSEYISQQQMQYYLQQQAQNQNFNDKQINVNTSERSSQYIQNIQIQPPNHENEEIVVMQQQQSFEQNAQINYSANQIFQKQINERSVNQSDNLSQNLPQQEQDLANFNFNFEIQNSNINFNQNQELYQQNQQKNENKKTPFDFDEELEQNSQGFVFPEFVNQIPSNIQKNEKILLEELPLPSPIPKNDHSTKALPQNEYQIGTFNEFQFELNPKQTQQQQVQVLPDSDWNNFFFNQPQIPTHQLLATSQNLFNDAPIPNKQQPFYMDDIEENQVKNQKRQELVIESNEKLSSEKSQKEFDLDAFPDIQEDQSNQSDESQQQINNAQQPIPQNQIKVSDDIFSKDQFTPPPQTNVIQNINEIKNNFQIASQQQQQDQSQKDHLSQISDDLLKSAPFSQAPVSEIIRNQDPTMQQNPLERQYPNIPDQPYSEFPVLVAESPYPQIHKIEDSQLIGDQFQNFNFDFSQNQQFMQIEPQRQQQILPQQLQSFQLSFQQQQPSQLQKVFQQTDQQPSTQVQQPPLQQTQVQQPQLQQTQSQISPLPSPLTSPYVRPQNDIQSSSFQMLPQQSQQKPAKNKNPFDEDYNGTDDEILFQDGDQKPQLTDLFDDLNEKKTKYQQINQVVDLQTIQEVEELNEVSQGKIQRSSLKQMKSSVTLSEQGSQKKPSNPEVVQKQGIIQKERNSKQSSNQFQDLLDIESLKNEKSLSELDSQLSERENQQQKQKIVTQESLELFDPDEHRNQFQKKQIDQEQIINQLVPQIIQIVKDQLQQDPEKANQEAEIAKTMQEQLNYFKQSDQKIIQLENKVNQLCSEVVPNLDKISKFMDNQQQQIEPSPSKEDNELKNLVKDLSELKNQIVNPQKLEEEEKKNHLIQGLMKQLEILQAQVLESKDEIDRINQLKENSNSVSQNKMDKFSRDSKPNANISPSSPFEKNDLSLIEENNQQFGQVNPFKQASYSSREQQFLNLNPQKDFISPKSPQMNYSINYNYYQSPMNLPTSYQTRLSQSTQGGLLNEGFDNKNVMKMKTNDVFRQKNLKGLDEQEQRMFKKMCLSDSVVLVDSFELFVTVKYDTIDVESLNSERTVVKATVTYKNKSHFLMSHLVVVVNPTRVSDKFYCDPLKISKTQLGENQSVQQEFVFQEFNPNILSISCAVGYQYYLRLDQYRRKIMITIARPPTKFFQSQFTSNEEIESIMEQEGKRIIQSDYFSCSFAKGIQELPHQFPWMIELAQKEQLLQVGGKVGIFSQGKYQEYYIKIMQNRSLKCVIQLLQIGESNLKLNESILTYFAFILGK